jgi:transcriptional regulator with XRE-family HTH domain
MRVRSVADMGAVVRERRRALGMTQRDLAELCRVSRPWLVAVEAGHQRAELGRVLRLLWALELSLDVFPTPPETGEDLVDLDALLERHRYQQAGQDSGA